jgi:hypothetical protein
MARSTSTTSSRSDGGDDTAALERRFGGDSDDEDAENVLTALSINISPGKKGRTPGGGKSSYHGGPSKRSGRHSVAADSAGAGPMTLRDQEQVSSVVLFVRRDGMKLRASKSSR